MKKLRRMIMEQGKGIGSDIVKVDMFLNHRIDTDILFDMGRAWADEFRKDKPDLVLKPGDYPNFPEGKSDRCHICFRGALFYAKAFALLAKENKLPIAELFKESDVSPIDAALNEPDIYIVRKDEAKDEAKKPEPAVKP